MGQIKKKFLLLGTGTDQLNSRDIPANFTPSNYTPSQVASEGTDKVSAHLKGIDNAIAVASGAELIGTSSLSISSGGTITIDLTVQKETVIIEGTSAISASTTPFGATAPVNGKTITIIGNSDTNTVTLSNNDAAKGCILNGNVVLGKYDVITLKYVSLLDRYIEVSRNV